MTNQQACEPHLDRLNTYIDLDRYPVHEPESSTGQALIAQAHQMMASNTQCLLEDFLREAAVAALSAEITPLEATAHELDYPCTLYGWMNNAGFPPDHPRSQLLQRSCSTITTEMLNPAGACLELYGFDELTDFERRLLNYDTLYRTVCPTLSAQINVMDENETFGWHFDTNDGVVSFTIQNADIGGGFEYAPLIRAEDDENYAAVARILSGADKPHQPRQTPGTLSLFLGRRSLHRSAPVGPTLHKRQSLLFSYDRNPGVVFPEMTCRRLTQDSPEPYLGALTPLT